MICKFSACFGYYIFTSLFVVNVIELFGSSYNPTSVYARFLPESEKLAEDENDPLRQLRALLTKLDEVGYRQRSNGDQSPIDDTDSKIQNTAQAPLAGSDISEFDEPHRAHHHHHHHHHNHQYRHHNPSEQHHRRHHNKRRRSLGGANNNQQPFFIAKNGAIVKRSKHLMLAKPYWPWP